MFNPQSTMAAKNDISEAVNSARQIGAARGLPQGQLQPQPGQMMPPGPPSGMPVAMPTMTMQGMPQGQPAMPPQMQQPGFMPGAPGGQNPAFQHMSPVVQQMLQMRFQRQANGAQPGGFVPQGWAPDGRMAGLAARYGVAGGPQQAAQATGPLGALMTSASGPMGG